MTSRLSVLAIDDEPTMIGLLEKVLTENGYAFEGYTSPAMALDAASRRSFDIALTDLMMPGMDGLELMRRLRGVSPETLVIIMTAFGTIETAVEAIKQGAYDYLTKPFRMAQVLLAIDKAEKDKLLRDEMALLRREVAEKYSFHNIVGRSKPMVDVFQLIQAVSRSDATVLIRGSSGTGKELVAKAIHYGSPRAEGPFVAVNCSALPETLLESELFGHVRGAFTGATSDRRGLFEVAGGGSIFLDEIGDLTAPLQLRLLRVLQEKEIRRVGDSASRSVDVRVIAATNRDLEAAMQEGRFRDDLYYRICVIPVHLPDLKDRREDIPILATHFLKGLAERAEKAPEGFEPAAMEALVSYDWPGNVRELENVIERAVTLGTARRISPDDLPVRLRDAPPPPEVGLELEGFTLHEAEAKQVVRAMEAAGGSKTKAARLLGIDRRTLYRKMEALEITWPPE